MGINNPLDAGSLRVFASSATSNGNVGGTTIVCSGLPTVADFDGNVVVLTSGDYKGESRSINGTTTTETITVDVAFTGQIDEGTKFGIFAIRSTAVALTHKVSCMEFWSVTDVVLDLPATLSAEILCPDIVVSLIPSGATIFKVLGMTQFRKISNLSAAGDNYIQGNQEMQIRKSDPLGSWATFFPLLSGQWILAASTSEGGGIFTADDASDCHDVVDGNATYDVRFENADAFRDTLTLYDLKVGLKIWFT